MNKGVLIIGETAGASVHKITYELLGKGRQLAQALNCPLDCLVLAAACDDLAGLNKRGADTVYFMASPSFDPPEEVLLKDNIIEFIKEQKPEIVLVGATHLGRSLAPRIAAGLQTGLTADCTELKIDEDKKLIQIRPAFSENILAHIKTKTMPQIATIRYKEFPEAEYIESRKENIVSCRPFAVQCDDNEILSVDLDQNQDIADAQVVVAGGRGFKRAEDLQLLKELADCVGGQVGYSRALVDAGMAESKYQIGYSGSRVKPVVYIACGISGAPQHIAGMKESGKVIAVNSDPSAPIFRICDYGYVGDLYEIIPELIRKFAERRNGHG